MSAGKEPGSAPATSAAPSPPERAPIGGAEFVELTLPDRSHAFVAVPVGARGPRPIVVGVHGAGDRADWSCTEWAQTLAGYPFVVCPTGVPSQWVGYVSWGSAEQIASRADRAVEMVRATYGDDVAPGPIALGGWSQGGTLAASVVASRPGVYRHVALVEVGHTALDASAVAALLRKGGVTRAVVSCSSVPCRNFARELTRAAARLALPLRVNDVGLRGHWFDEPVFRSLGPAFVWMVEDDASWTGVDAAVTARWGTGAATAAER